MHVTGADATVNVKPDKPDGGVHAVDGIIEELMVAMSVGQSVGQFSGGLNQMTAVSKLLQ